MNPDDKGNVMDPIYNDRSLSKVEVSGFEARHYDFFMNVITAGTYPFFIRQAVREMHIKPDDRILVFGSGTGRNLSLMEKYLSGDKSRIVGLDIGREMLEQARRRFADDPRVEIVEKRIDSDLSYTEEFDKVFMSFVLHGFIQEDRLKIFANARRALRNGGELIILDYNEFDLKSAPWLVRKAFDLECPLATDFVGRDLKKILTEAGFGEFRFYPHYLGYVRLLAARKM